MRGKPYLRKKERKEGKEKGGGKNGVGEIRE